MIMHSYVNCDSNLTSTSGGLPSGIQSAVLRSNLATDARCMQAHSNVSRDLHSRGKLPSIKMQQVEMILIP